MYDFAVEDSEVGDALDDFGLDGFAVLVAVDGVVEEGEFAEGAEVLELDDLIPALDVVVRDVKSGQLHTGLDAFELLDVVVREPKFPQHWSHFFEALDSFDVVSSQGQHLQVFWPLRDGLLRFSPTDIPLIMFEDSER